MQGDERAAARYRAVGGTVSEVEIRIAESAAEVREALRFANDLHQADPAWVPILVGLTARRTLGWIRERQLQLLIARRGDAIVGTISVLRDRDFERDKGEKVAWFGYFDAIDDPDVVRSLVDAANERARALGAVALRGPRDLTRFENAGVTVEGHALLPPFLCRHHPVRYAAALEAVGFEKHHDVLAYHTPVVDERGAVRDLPDALRSKSVAVDLPGLEVRSARRRSMSKDLIAAHEVMNTAFQTVPDIAPMPRSTFVAMGRPYLLLADPRLLQIATQDGRPVGFAACFPELNEALRHARGSLLPLGWGRVLAGLRHVRTASFKLIGVVPELRGSGLHARLIAEIVDGVRAAGYHRLEASVIDERNGPMRAVVEHAGMTIYRRYRFYQRPVA
jgi:GNAT superfamily N-acetyltransferase